MMITNKPQIEITGTGVLKRLQNPKHHKVKRLYNIHPSYTIHHYSIQGKTNPWTQAFLTDRTQGEGEPSSEVITEELNRPNEVGNSE